MKSNLTVSEILRDLAHAGCDDENSEFELNNLAREAERLINELLKRVDREARLSELLNIPFNDGRFSNEWIKEHWAERIKILKETEVKDEN